MSAEPAPGSITCPNCGTGNRSGSVFCAECGTLLPHADDDTQATASFTPVTDTRDQAEEAWDIDDAQTTQVFTPRATPDHPESNGAPVWSTPMPGSAPYIVPEGGRRGFVLGVIASILILLVFGFFLWSTVVSQGFRDTITGIF